MRRAIWLAAALLISPVRALAAQGPVSARDLASHPAIRDIRKIVRAVDDHVHSLSVHQDSAECDGSRIHVVATCSKIPQASCANTKLRAAPTIRLVR